MLDTPRFVHERKNFKNLIFVYINTNKNEATKN